LAKQNAEVAAPVFSVPLVDRLHAANAHPEGIKMNKGLRIAMQQKLDGMLSIMCKFLARLKV
jgi:hypothetical protein